jgi:toxin CcdB
MNQFDVVANPFPRSSDRQPLFVALQSDLLARTLDTVVVAPLELATSGKFADLLNPSVSVNGESYAVIAQEIVTVRKSTLGKAVGSVASDGDKIIAALDLLFTGF